MLTAELRFGWTWVPCLTKVCNLPDGQVPLATFRRLLLTLHILDMLHDEVRIYLIWLSCKKVKQADCIDVSLWLSHNARSILSSNHYYCSLCIVPDLGSLAL